MKVEKSIVQKRRDHIMQLIQKDGRISVNEIAEMMNVSPLTVRRDLQYWEEQGAVERNYGGAILLQNMVSQNSELSNERYKHAIAKYAAQYVEDGDIIFINTSSTALLVISYIRNKRCTIITNNGKAIYVEHDPLISLVLTGGELRDPKESMVGEFATSTLRRVTANKAFMGCSGLDVKAGMTTAIMNEVAINEIMLNRCNGTTFVLADHTKIGIEHNFRSGTIDQVNYLITDQLCDLEDILKIEDAKVKVIQLPPINVLDMHKTKTIF